MWPQRGPTAEPPAMTVEPTFLKDKASLLILQKSARRIFQEIAQELYHKRYVETSQQPVSIKQPRTQFKYKASIPEKNMLSIIKFSFRRLFSQRSLSENLFSQNYDRGHLIQCLPGRGPHFSDVVVFNPGKALLSTGSYFVLQPVSSRPKSVLQTCAD